MSPHITSSERATHLAGRNITVRFQGLSAIADVTIELQRHEILGLIGPNGAGKTTLVNVLTGFQRPTEGIVELGQHRFDGHTADAFRRKGVARTFQSGRLYKHLSMFENVEVTGLGLGLTRQHAQREAERLLEWVGLDGRFADLRVARRACGWDV